MWSETELSGVVATLEAIGMADATNAPLDGDELASITGWKPGTVATQLDAIQRGGLALIDDGQPPRLTAAGKQFLRRRGDVPSAVVGFLPHVIDDLYGRSALLRAGSTLVDIFRLALLEGHGVEHAQLLVPSAFAVAVDEEVALNLYAAAVALLARLSNDAPAGCVAEEIMTVALIREAEEWLEMDRNEGRIDDDEFAAATSSLEGLFELLEDSDVLRMFDMDEPSDAAVAAQDSLNRVTGVADQRIESWLVPFGGVVPTGYLAEG